jgi:hypothetical protein
MTVARLAHQLYTPVGPAGLHGVPCGFGRTAALQPWAGMSHINGIHTGDAAVNEDAIAVFIPIVAIIMSLSIPIVFAIIDYKRRRDIVESHHKERMAAIERGMELPPLPDALFSSFKSNRRPRYLLSGMIWLFTGLAAFTALWRVANDDVAFFALIPAAVGVALLLYYFIEGRKDTVEEDVPSASQP